MLGYVDMRKAVPVTFSVVRIRIIWILQGMIKQALFNPDQEYTAREIPYMYYFSGNSAASAPISTFMCLRAIYIFPGSVYSTYFLQQNRQTDRGNI
jgi:hypothetical protein